MTHSETADIPKQISLKTWASKPVIKGSPLTLAVHFLLRVLLITLTEFKKSEISLRSSALTYTILLSLVPMLAMSTALVKGLGGGNHLRDVAYTYIDTLETSGNLKITENTVNAPEITTETTEKNTNLTGHLRSAVDKVFDYVEGTNFAALGTIGVIGILLGVLLVLGHIEAAMNTIWKVTAPRSILRKLADYLTLIILLPISINVAFAAGAFLKSPLLAHKMDLLIPFSWLQSLLLKPLPVLFITLTFFAMYIFFPNTRVKSLPATAGAAVAALLWFTVQNIYITLQLGVSNYNAIYGSFATLPLFLVWIYLGWIFILSGAQLAFAIQNVRTYSLIPYKGTPSLKLGAAFDIMEQIYTAFTARKAVTIIDLPEQLPHYSPSIISDAANELIMAGEIHVSTADGRLLPTSPVEEYNRQKVVNIILGTEAPETAGGNMSRKAIEAVAQKSKRQPQEVLTPEK